MKVLLCGGREYNDLASVRSAMAQLPFTPTLIIEGGARGADTQGKLWAIENGIHYAEIPALWDSFGKSAGHRRNAAMLWLMPDYCVAFPGGRGTAGMVEMCNNAGVTVWQPYGP